MLKIKIHHINVSTWELTWEADDWPKVKGKRCVKSKGMKKVLLELPFVWTQCKEFRLEIRIRIILLKRNLDYTTKQVIHGYPSILLHTCYIGKNECYNGYKIEWRFLSRWR